MSAPGTLSTFRTTTSSSLSVLGRSVRYAAVVATTFGSIATASAAQFTFNPAAVGLGANGNAFTADTLTLGDFSTVKFASTGPGPISFTQSGFLPVVSAFNGINPVSTPGLNTTYSLYYAFTATGTQSSADVLNSPTNGTYSSITIQLFGSTTPTTFTFNGTTNNPEATSAGTTTLLATGSNLPGTNTVGTDPVAATQTSPPSFAPRASVTTSLLPTVAGAPFFVSPNPFYTTEFSTFINLSNQITPLFTGNNVSGFQINAAGGGTSNFAVLPVPEPVSLALLGSALVGFAAVRRRTAR